MQYMQTKTMWNTENKFNVMHIYGSDFLLLCCIVELA